MHKSIPWSYPIFNFKNSSAFKWNSSVFCNNWQLYFLGINDTNLAAFSIGLNSNFGGATFFDKYLQIKILFWLISFNHSFTNLLVFKSSSQSLAFWRSKGFYYGPTINLRSVLYAMKESINGYVNISMFNNVGISLLGSLLFKPFYPPCMSLPRISFFIMPYENITRGL